jgi:dynein heavy chain
MQPSASTNLSRYLEMNLEQYIEQFEIVSEGASKEFSLEKALTKMRADWATVNLTVLPYRDSGTCILSAVDDIQVLELSVAFVFVFRAGSW